MPQTLPSLRLTGATILRDGALQDRSVAFAEGRITRGPLPEVDLTGYLVLPGIIDLHGDAFERHMAPRPTAPFPWRQGCAPPTVTRPPMASPPPGWRKAGPGRVVTAAPISPCRCLTRWRPTAPTTP